MDYWVTELEAVRLRIVEIEGRIEELRRLAQELHPQGPDDNLQARLIDVLNGTLDRTTTQLQFIEQRAGPGNLHRTISGVSA
jgi:hypothetical protein